MHAMFGLDYVALRYFNVYGPRMDVHGLYTEVLVRWMERIADGKPPLILGDGAQTMDFVYMGDIARANMLAADVRPHRRRLQRRQRDRDEPARARRDAAAGDGLRPGGRARPGARRSTASRAGWPTRAPAREQLGFEAEVDLEEGLTRLVEWWRAERAGVPSAADRRRSRGRPDAGPVQPSVPARRRGRRGRRDDRLRLGLAGPARARVRGGVRRARRRRRRRRDHQLHDRAAARALRLGRRARRRGDRPLDVVHRDRERRLAERRRSRCSPTSTRGPTTSIPARPSGRSRAARRRSCRCTSSACRPTWTRSSRSASAHGLAIVEDAACAIGAALPGPADRLARAARLLLAASRARSSPPARAA